MANHKLLASIILKWEGGWANDPTDMGGMTIKGITMETYKSYCLSKGKPQPTPEALRNISEQEWFDIFKAMYWDRWHADAISNQSVANILVDWVWASGSWGIKIPQRLLGTTEDGIVGSKTLTLLQAQDSETFFNKIKEERLKFVDDIVRRKPEQAKFIKGWKNRINEFHFSESCER